MGGGWLAYCAVHKDYESVAVVAAGLAAPVTVAHALVACQLGLECVRTGDTAHCKERLAFKLIGPVATSTAAFHHVVEMFVLLLECGGIGGMQRPSSCFYRRCRWNCQ